MNPATLRNLGVAVAAWVTLAPTSQAADATPACNADAHYSQQDFALGKWDVYSGAHKVAETDLEKVLDGCGIRSTWTPVGMREGNEMGLFTYSRRLGHWAYFYVADTGEAAEFSGDSPGTNAMLYVPPPRGKTQRRLTLELRPDGSIQMLSVGSTDGRTWSKEYELIWRKRK